MKINYFNFFVIFLFVFIILSATSLSCTKFQPHSAESIFQKHSDFEGFHDKAQTIGYAKKDDYSPLDNHNMNLIKSENTSGEKVVNYCKNIFGFHGLYCDPTKEDAVIETGEDYRNVAPSSSNSITPSVYAKKGKLDIVKFKNVKLIF